MEERQIGLNKWKLVAAILFSILFIFNGLTLVFESNISGVQTNLFLTKFIGLASLLFFGFILYFSSKQLFDNSLGIYFDKTGLSDYSSAYSVGQVEWKHIERIEIVKSFGMKSLAIHTNNPEKYLQEAKGFKLRLLAGNLSRLKTPVVISARNLKSSHANLEKLIMEYWEKSKDTHS